MTTQLEINKAFREYANEIGLSLRKIDYNGEKILNPRAAVSHQDHLSQLLDTDQISANLAYRATYR